MIVCSSVLLLLMLLGVLRGVKLVSCFTKVMSPSPFLCVLSVLCVLYCGGFVVVGQSLLLCLALLLCLCVLGIGVLVADVICGVPGVGPLVVEAIWGVAGVDAQVADAVWGVLCMG